MFMRASGDPNQVVAVLLGCAALCGSAESPAQARGPSVSGVQGRAQARARPELAPEIREKKRSELEAWLRRLTGSFRVTGAITNTAYNRCEGRLPGTCFSPPVPPPVGIKGVADCASVGTGPGVHCLFKVTWDVPRPPFVQLIWDPWLDPGTMLIGLDAADLTIRYLQVDYWGIAEHSVDGELKGDEVTFRFGSFPYSRSRDTLLTNRQPFCSGCSRIVRIAAPSDRDIIRMSVEAAAWDLVVSYNFTLARKPR